MNISAAAIILSMLPISEVRGGIPLAICSGSGWLEAFLICTAFNILIIFPLFFFLDYLNNILLKIKWYEHFFNRQLNSARRKVQPSVKKYGWLGLILFVGIPLPFTGAYTGTLAAWALGMERKKAILSISLGVLMAGVIVTIVTLSGISWLRFFIKNVC
ncbi:MAG: small multi-drug export protein [Candidatus Woesearchaeota archaeon]